jgi:hypothetical protein
VKRIRLLILLGVVTAALVVPAIAKAHGDYGSSNQVSIVSPAQYNFNGTYITVQLYVRCKPAGTDKNGFVNLTVDQYYPETPDPAGAHGTFFANVVCDNQTRAVGVTVPVGPYDAGTAKAKAELFPPSTAVPPPTSPAVTTSRWITIVANG